MNKEKKYYNINQRLATEKYMEANFDVVRIRVRKGKKEKISALAKSQGKSTTAYIIDLIERDAKRLNYDLSVPLSPAQQKKEDEK